MGACFYSPKDWANGNEFNIYSFHQNEQCDLHVFWVFMPSLSHGTNSEWTEAGHGDGPWPLNSTGRHGQFLKWTCDMEPIGMPHGFQIYSAMWQGYFLNSTRNMGINKWQRHGHWLFLKIDRRHGDPPSRAPWGIIYMPVTIGDGQE